MTPKYYKFAWPEPIVPEGEPHWLYYEVVDENVLRLVDEMASGELKRKSVVRENAMGPPCISLFHGDFIEAIDGQTFERLSREQFEALFNAATDY